MEAGPAPLILFLPGNEMNAAQYSSLLAELASQGYAVAAIDHPYDSRAVRLANGKVAAFAGAKWPPPAPGGPTPAETPHSIFYRSRVEARVADARFVLTRLTEQLAGKLNPTAVGIAGHSVGGVAAGHACQQDKRFRACLNLDGSTADGPFYLTAAGRAFDQPYLMMTKPFAPSDDRLREWGITRDTWSRNYRKRLDSYFGAIGGGSMRVTVVGAAHNSFSDDAIVMGLLAKAAGAEDARKLLAIVRRYTVAFFDRHLRGAEATALEIQPPFPEVAIDRWP
jgi:hypothetical protein